MGVLKKKLLFQGVCALFLFSSWKLFYFKISGTTWGQNQEFARVDALSELVKPIHSTDYTNLEQQYHEFFEQSKYSYNKLNFNQSNTNHDIDRALANLLASNPKCENVVRPHNSIYSSTGKYWHLHQDGKEEIMVISSFYDDREAAGILPSIRSQVVATPAKKPHYCYIWYEGLKYPLIVKANIKSTGRGEKVLGIYYGQWLYSCQLPSSLPIPSHVSIVTKLCASPSMKVPIYIPVRAKWEHEFGICVAIAFGNIDQANLIEWIELNKIFGVTEINIYNASLAAELNNVFHYYENSGLLRVHKMPPPKPDFSKKGSKLNSPASLNDCMYRNMYRYRYMIVIDFDEFIIPVKHSNYSIMLKNIDRDNKLKESWQSYTFRNAYHFLETGPDDSQPKYLKTMRYRKRIKPSGYLFAPKSFIDPRKCLSVFNHYCWIRFPSLPGKLTIDVSPNTALSHHFRNCNLGKERCKEYQDTSVNDDVFLKYKKVLDKRTQEVLSKL